MKRNFVGPLSLCAVIAFAALARGAHDLWSATLVHLVVLIFLAGLVLVISLNNSSEGFRVPLVGPMLFLFGAALISFYGAGNPSESLMALKDLLASILLFYIAVNVLKVQEQLSVFALGMVPVVIIQAVILLTQAQGFHFSESPGTLINANVQAAFFLFWLPVLLDRIANGETSRPVWWLWRLGLLAVLVGFVVTGSVWGWIVAILAIMFWSRQMGFRLKRLIGPIAVILIGILIFKMGPTWISAGHWPFSVTNRLAWWHTAVRMFMDHPWRGVGIGNFPSAFLTYKVPMGENTLFAHSLPFQLLAETGLLGVASFGLAGVLLFRGLAFFHEKSNLEKAYGIGGMAVLGFCCFNLAAEYFLIQMMLAVFLSSLVRLPPPTLKPRMPWAILLIGLSILSFPYVAAPFLASRHLVTGQAHVSAGEWKQAEQSFQTAIELDGRNWQAHQGLAQVHFEKFRIGKEFTGLNLALHAQDEAIRFNKLNKRLRQERDFLISFFPTS